MAHEYKIVRMLFISDHPFIIHLFLYVSLQTRSLLPIRFFIYPNRSSLSLHVHQFPIYAHPSVHPATCTSNRPSTQTCFYEHEVNESISKAIPVTVREVLYIFEMSRIPHCLDNRLLDGGEFVSLTRLPRFTPQKYFWFSFLLDAE
jgi:hypothetical protein